MLNYLSHFLFHIKNIFFSTLTRISRENICLFVLFLSVKYIILVPISWKMRSMAFLTYKKVYFNCFYQLK